MGRWRLKEMCGNGTRLWNMFNDDLMPSSRAMNIAIFLDEVTEFNGPLLFIPGSHKKGIIEANHDITTTKLSTLDN